MTHRGTTELATPRIRLRRYAIEDAEGMFRNYAADERVSRFLNWVAYTDVEGVRSFLQDQIPRYGKTDFYHWAMVFEDQVIGGISAYDVSEKNHSCEVGCCLGHAWWNRGLASEALAAVLRYLFTRVGVHRVTATHDVENPASGRVMEKCGMRPEGRLREHYRRHDGSYSDAIIYGLLVKDVDEDSPREN